MPSIIDGLRNDCGLPVTSTNRPVITSNLLPLIDYSQLLSSLGDEMLVYLDVPYLPLPNLPTITLEEQSYKTKKGNEASSKIKQKFNYLFKDCQEFEDVMAEGSAEHVLIPALSLTNYFEQASNYKRQFDFREIKTSILQEPKHGELIEGIDSRGDISYSYYPAPGYLGKDSAGFVAEFNGKRYKITSELRVVRPHAGESNCPPNRLMKLSQFMLKPNDYKVTFRDIKDTQPKLNQFGIDNNTLAPHEHQFQLYLKPTAPLEIAKGPQAVMADFGSKEEVIEDVNNVQIALVQASSSSLVKKKFDKIVSECTMARTYANDSTHPAMVAQGQYANNYEEYQKLKVLNLEVVTKPKHGNLNLITTTKNGRGELFPPYFEMVAHSVDYIGEDFAEYRVDLSNGKSVLVREYMFWVNKELDSFGGCGASKKQIREMREYQKKHPEEFKKASVSYNFLLSPTNGATTLITGKAVEIHLNLLSQASD